MYGLLTANISGCVALSLPVQRRSPQGLRIPAFFRPSFKASAARGSEVGQVKAPVARSQVTTNFQGRL
jgi:hypothetical protein